MNERIVKALHKKNLDKISLLSIKEMVVTSVWNSYDSLKAKIFGKSGTAMKEDEEEGGILDKLPDLPSLPEDNTEEPCIGLNCDYSLPEVEDPPEQEPMFSFGDSD